MDLYSIDQARLQVLLRGIRAAAEGHIPVSGRLDRAVEGGLDSVGDEAEGRTAAQLDWFCG